MKKFLQSRLLVRLTNVGLLTGVLTVAPLFATGSSAHATSSGTQGAGKCSLATVKGQYIFADDGYQLVGGKQVPFAEAGQELYDGKGHLTQGIVSNSEGGKITRLLHYTGTYTITPECLMTITFTDTTGAVSHFDQFVSPDGSKFTFVETDKGVVESGWETRVHN